MTPRRILSLAAVLALVAPAVAYAQAGAESATDRPGIGTLVPALDRVGSETSELQSLGRLTLGDLRVVRVASVIGSEERGTFGDALARNRTQVDELRKFLSTTDLQVVGADEVTMTLGEYLSGNDVGVREVVAVDVAGNAVTLYVDEPEVEVGVESTMRGARARRCPGCYRSAATAGGATMPVPVRSSVTQASTPWYSTSPAYPLLSKIRIIRRFEVATSA